MSVCPAVHMLALAAGACALTAGPHRSHGQQHPDAPYDEAARMMQRLTEIGKMFEIPLLSPDDALEEVDAWVLYGCNVEVLSFNHFSPILLTLRAALKATGARTLLVDQSSNELMLQAIRKAAAKGRHPLLVSVAHWCGKPETADVLKACAQAGAKLVLYQTEPQLWAVQRMMRMVAELGASEVWEYTKETLRRYSKSPSFQAIVRYVPPGYNREWDAGVDATNSSWARGTIGFVGDLNNRPEQAKQLRLQLGDKLVNSYGVWSPEDWRKFVEGHPIQLTLSRDSVFCPFRVSNLMPYKPCIVSDFASGDDMLEFDGVVHFVELKDTLRKFEEVQRDLAGCRQRQYAVYKERFDPLRILQRSGFLDAWRPRH